MLPCTEVVSMPVRFKGWIKKHVSRLGKWVQFTPISELMLLFLASPFLNWLPSVVVFFLASFIPVYLCWVWDQNLNLNPAAPNLPPAQCKLPGCSVHSCSSSMFCIDSLCWIFITLELFSSLHVNSIFHAFCFVFNKLYQHVSHFRLTHIPALFHCPPSAQRKCSPSLAIPPVFHYKVSCIQCCSLNSTAIWA